MKNYNEMADDVFRRRDEYEIAQKEKRRMITRTAVPLSLLVFVVLIGIGVSQANMPKEEMPSALGTSQSGGTQSVTKHGVTEDQNIYYEQSGGTSGGNIGVDGIDSIYGPCILFPRWNERTISDQFSEADYKGAQYFSRTAKISANYINENLGKVVMTGYDPYTDTSHTKNAMLYSVKNFSTACIIAVQFEGKADYYVYANRDYSPATLGAFINDLNLKKSMTVGSVYYLPSNDAGVKFVNLSTATVWEKLLSNTALKNEYKAEEDMYFGDWIISINCNIPLLGYDSDNINFGVTEEGYIVSDILGYSAFYIGKDKCREFIDYIVENCNGTELEPVTVIN